MNNQERANSSSKENSSEKPGVAIHAIEQIRKKIEYVAEFLKGFDQNVDINLVLQDLKNNDLFDDYFAEIQDDISSPEALRLFLIRLKTTLEQELKQVETTVKFFDKESSAIVREKLSNQFNMVQAAALTGFGKDLLVQVGREGGFSYGLKSMVDKTLVLCDLLGQNESMGPDILEAINDINCLIQKEQIDLPILVGESAFNKLSTKLYKIDSVEDFRSWKHELSSLLTSPRIVTSLVVLNLFEKHLLSLEPGETVKQQLNILLSQVEIENLCNLQKLGSEIGLLISHEAKDEAQPKSSNKLTQDQKKLLAAYFGKQVAGGELDPVLARELWFDCQSQSAEVIIARSLAAASELLMPYSESKDKKTKKTSLKLVSIFLIIFILFNAATPALTDTTSKNGNGFFNDYNVAAMVSSLEELPQDFYDSVRVHLDFLNLPEKDLSFSLSQAEQPVHDFSPPSEQQMQELELALAQHDENKLSSFNNTQTQYSQYESSYLPTGVIKQELESENQILLEGPKQLGFEPSAVDSYDFGRNARNVVYQLTNWQDNPGDLVTTTFIDFSPTNFFSREINIDLLDARAKQLPLVNDPDKSPNIMLGDSKTLGLGWRELSHPENMLPQSGSLLVLDGDKVLATFPLMISQADFDFYMKVLVEPNFILELTKQNPNLTFRTILQFDHEETTVIESDLMPKQEVPPETFYLFPESLQQLLNQLNQNDQMNYPDKASQVIAWFNNCGVYSFAYENNQDIIIDEAIRAGRVAEKDRFIAWVGVFFQGASYEPLGLDSTSQFPRPCAGECNRRNFAAWVALQFLQTDEEWLFFPETLFLVNSSLDYDSVVGEVRASQAHMRLFGYNRETQEIKIFDATSAPEIDEETRTALDQASRVAERALIWQSIESHLYPTVSPDIKVDIESLIQGEVVPSGYQLLPQIFSFSKDITDAPWSFESLPPDTWTPEVYLFWEDQKTLVFRPEFTNPKADDLLLFVEDGVQPIEWITTTVTLNGTNVFPIPKPKWGNEYSDVIDFPGREILSSFSLTIEGKELPFRIENLQEPSGGDANRTLLSFIVIDLPPDLIKGMPIQVTFAREQVKYGFTKDKRHELLTNYSDLELRENYLTNWSTVRQEMLKFGFSENEIEWLTISKLLKQIRNFDQVKEILTDLINKKESQGEIFNNTLSILSNLGEYEDQDIDEELISNLIATVDQLLPDSVLLGEKTNALRTNFYNTDLLSFRNEGWSAHDHHFLRNELSPDEESRFYNEAIIENRRRLEAGEKPTVAVFFEPKAVITLPDEKAIAFLFLFYSLFELYFYSSYPTDSFLSSKINLPTNEATNLCGELTTTMDEFIKCNLSSPILDPTTYLLVDHLIGKLDYISLSLPATSSPEGSWIKSQITLNPKQSDYLFAFSLNKEYTTSSASSYDRFSATEEPSDFFTQDSWWKLMDALDKSNIPEEQLAYLEKSFAQLPEVMADKDVEMDKWYRQQILDGLLKGNPWVWVRFLTLFFPTALVSGGLLAALARRRRWAESRDVIEWIKRRKQGLSHDNLDELVRNVVGGRKVSAYDRNKILDSVYAANQTGPEMNALRQAVVARRQIKPGEPKVLARLSRLGTGDNPWRSREVPATYWDYIKFFDNELKSLSKIIDGEDKTDSVRSIIDKRMQHGISNGVDTSFTNNELLLDDPTEWRKQFIELLLTEMKEKVKVGTARQEMMPWVVGQVADYAQAVWTRILDDVS